MSYTSKKARRDQPTGAFCVNCGHTWSRPRRTPWVSLARFLDLHNGCYIEIRKNNTTLTGFENKESSMATNQQMLLDIVRQLGQLQGEVTGLNARITALESIVSHGSSTDDKAEMAKVLSIGKRLAEGENLDLAGILEAIS